MASVDKVLERLIANGINLGLISKSEVADLRAVFARQTNSVPSGKNSKILRNLLNGATQQLAYETNLRAQRELEIVSLSRQLNCEQEPMPTWVLMARPGMVPVRKGPFKKPTETAKMLQEMYHLYPGCVCIVINMSSNCWPESGVEWLRMHGDGLPVL